MPKALKAREIENAYVSTILDLSSIRDAARAVIS
jgi:hypothetical protein